MKRRKKDIMILAILLPILVLVIAFPIRKMGRRNADGDVEQEDVAAAQSENDHAGELEQAQWEKIRAQQLALENRYLEQGIPRDPFV